MWTYTAVMARYCDLPAKNIQYGYGRQNAGKAGFARTSVPDLRLYPRVVYPDYASGEFDTDCRSALGIEFVTYEPRQHCSDEMSAFISHPLRLYTCSFCAVAKVGM